MESLLPKSYHLNLGCHNCAFSVLLSRIYCTKLQSLPLSPLSSTFLYDDNDMDSLDKYHRILETMEVDEYGHCDEWKLRGGYAQVA